MMSPGSKTSASSSMTASVPLPACTMMIAVRGFESDAANSSIVFDATKPASGCSSSRVSVRAQERLYTATVLPSRLARLRARLLPMTASPTTPMFACATVFSLYSAGRVAAKRQATTVRRSKDRPPMRRPGRLSLSWGDEPAPAHRRHGRERLGQVHDRVTARRARSGCRSSTRTTCTPLERRRRWPPAPARRRRPLALARARG